MDKLSSIKKIDNWYDKNFLGKYIDYIECNEQNYLFISMNKNELTEKHTHCEIHPSLTLSHYTNTIPFVNHNQALVSFSWSTRKASYWYATNYNSRIDTASYVYIILRKFIRLNYPNMCLKINCQMVRI